LGAGLVLFPAITRRFDPFSPPIIVIIFTIPQLLRPLYWYMQGQPELNRYFQEPGHVLRACILASVYLLIGQAVYYIAFYGLKPSQRITKLFPAFTSTGWDDQHTRRIIGIYLFVGFAAYMIFMQQVGGIMNFVTHIYVRSSLSEGLGFISIFMHTLVVAALVTFCYLVAARNGIKKFWLVAIPVLILTATLGGRGFLILPTLMLLICYHYTVKRFSLKKLSIIAAAGLAFFITAGAIRNSLAPDAKMSLANDFAGGVDAYFQDQNQLDMFAVLIDDMPKNYPFQYGTTWLRLLTLPIPSKLWPNKPALFEGRVTAENYFGDHAGIPPGYVGVLYMNFYVWGIIPGFFILGRVHRALYEYAITRRHNLRAVCFYALTIVTLWELSNGAFINWLGYAPFLLFAFWYSAGLNHKWIKVSGIHLSSRLNNSGKQGSSPEPRWR
jgi:oligosaccharide repeat unit polymerase